jgi:hypothetical protein
VLNIAEVRGWPEVTIAGIVPSLNGAVAIFATDGELRFRKMPRQRCRRGRRDYDRRKMLAILTDQPIGLAIIESAEVRPEHAEENYFGVGLWSGMLTALRIRHIVLTPRWWRGRILAGTQCNEQDAFDYFSRRFGPVSRAYARRGRKPSDSAVVTACLCEYGRRVLEDERTFREQPELFAQARRQRHRKAPE